MEFFSQTKYPRDIRRKYGMESPATMETPMNTSVKLDRDENGVSVDTTRYCGIIGSNNACATGADDEEEIPEEEAICRICFDECDEGTTFKMECSCKGALRLVHKKCLVTWFNTKTNGNCDVCGREVLNFPVSLLRVPTTARRTTDMQDQNRPAANSQQYSVCQDFVVLMLISTICYFFFLEQLLIERMKIRAITIAAPFSFTLGLMASLFALNLAIREYIWTLAALEFALVAVVLHIFYSILNIGPVYVILYSALLGFGMALGLNSLYIRLYTWGVQIVRSSDPV